jgi:hypothetical protein
MLDSDEDVGGVLSENGDDDELELVGVELGCVVTP